MYPRSPINPNNPHTSANKELRPQGLDQLPDGCPGWIVVGGLVVAALAMIIVVRGVGSSDTGKVVDNPPTTVEVSQPTIAS